MTIDCVVTASVRLIVYLFSDYSSAAVFNVT